MESRIVNIMSHKQRNSGTYFFCSRAGSILTFTKEFAEAVLSDSEESKFESIVVYQFNRFDLEGYAVFPPSLARFLLEILILQDKYNVGQQFVTVLGRHLLNVFPLSIGVWVTVFWENERWNLDVVAESELRGYKRLMQIFSFSHE